MEIMVSSYLCGTYRWCNGAQADVPDLSGPVDAAAEARQHASVCAASSFASHVPTGTCTSQPFKALPKHALLLIDLPFCFDTGADMLLHLLQALNMCGFLTLLWLLHYGQLNMAEWMQSLKCPVWL